MQNLIPDRSDNWIIKNNMLMYKKYVNLPVCVVQSDIVYIFLDNKIPNQIIKLTKHLISKKIKFFFTTPEYSAPNTIIDNNKVINHYLHSYVNKHFFIGFRKIEFDLIKNLLEWCEKEDCHVLIKENYDIISKKVMRKNIDFYTNKIYYEYEEEIRQDFYTLYREIQINYLIT
jgi:hypothetical protein